MMAQAPSLRDLTLVDLLRLHYCVAILTYPYGCLLLDTGLNLVVSWAVADLL